jgi:hypothetical protein
MTDKPEKIVAKRPSKHRCFACGEPHLGDKPENCKLCGKAWQESLTYRIALHRIAALLRKNDTEAALRIAREAIIVGPMGERLDTGAHPDFPSPFKDKAQLALINKFWWHRSYSSTPKKQGKLHLAELTYPDSRHRALCNIAIPLSPASHSAIMHADAFRKGEFCKACLKIAESL